jgi:sRNA-binding protein
MKKKWSSDKVRLIQKWLIERWPELFKSSADLKPLSLSIYKDILEFRDENPELSGRVLREALKRHTTSYGYLYGMLKYSHRYGLDGEQIEVVSPEHRDWAKSTLKVKQKVAQKVRKKRGQQLAIARAGARAAKTQPLTASVHGRTVRKAPVIRYKQPKRRQIDTSRPLDLLAS